MSLHLNRSIRPFLRSTSLSSSLPRPVHPTSSARLPGLPSSRSQSQASGQSTGPRTGIGQLLADLNLTYTLPLSFAIGIGLYAYLQSQLPDDIESTRTTRISSKEPLPALIDLPQSNHKSIIDPATQIAFPTELVIDTEATTREPLRLVGVGVRTVSFLAVKVYSAGFYADPRVLRALRVIPGWDTDLTKEDLLLNKAGMPASESDPRTGEKLMNNLLSAPVHFAIQIAPARSTDFAHLRDGFCRSLAARISRASKEGLLTESEAERATESISVFRGFFPSAVSVPKGKTLLLRRTPGHSLVLEYDGRKLGEVQDPVIARELFLAYFADIDPISKTFKEAVAEGFEKLYRPTSSDQKA